MERKRDILTLLDIYITKEKVQADTAENADRSLRMTLSTSTSTRRHHLYAHSHN